MIRIVLIFLLLALAVPLCAVAGVISPARIQFIDGDVMFRSPDLDEWLPATVNTPFDEGDTIWAPPGCRTEIQLGDGSIVRLDGGSQLDLIALEESFTHLHLARGRLYVKTFIYAKGNVLQIDADDTTILPEARTRLRIDMLPNNQEDVSIFKGSAYVEGNGNRTQVRAGEHIALEEGHSELLALNSPDNWERWNSDRDRSQSRTATAESNLPEELLPYSGELDASGRWLRVPEYGMVWRPTVILSDDWAPYRSGRWIWKGKDYVWISYENWGWAPYHFGRWAVISGFGWCWVPPVRGDIYWGPGYVGWYRTENHVGWTPLAPGETYYGHRQYGLHSVNITHSSINTATIAYKNRGARGGFSVLLQNDFLRGIVSFQNPANVKNVSISVSPGSPRIQPMRETRMPIIKQTPPRAASPVIQHQDSRDLRSRFPRVTPNAENRQRTQPTIVSTEPAAPTGTARQSAQPVSRQNENRQPQTTIPQTFQNRPERRDQRNFPDKAETHSAQRTPVRQGDGTGQNLMPKELKQRKVWKITTMEQGGEKDQKEKEGKEHKGKK